MQFDCVGIGTNCVDLVMNPDRIPQSDENVVSLSIQTAFGGVASNAVFTLSKLGMKTAFIGIVGTDIYTDALLKDFTESNIDIQHIIRKSGKNAISFVVVNKKGERTIVHFPGDSPILPPKEIEPLIPKLIGQTRFIHIDGLYFFSDIKLAEEAKGSETKISFDMSAPLETFTGMGVKLEDIKRLISLCDVFIPCKLACQSLTGKKDPKEGVIELAKLGPEIVGTTLGSRGCVIARGDEIIEKPAFNIKVKDTTGAGDSFHGAFIYGLLQDWDLESMAEFSNAVAALVCKKRGSRTYLPSLDDVNKFLESQK